MQRWTEASWQEGPDPFARPPATPTGLAAGWLVDPPAPSASTPREPDRARGVSARQQVPASTPAAPGNAAGIASRRELVTPWQALGATWRRLERRAAARFRAVPHPLAATRLLRGMTPAETRRLTRRFQEETPVSLWNSQEAALGHLAQLLRGWPVRTWDDVRGLHVFLGPAGSGKTTLLFRVARQLHRRGTKVTAVTLCTAAAARAAFAASAGERGITAFCAANPAQLERVLDSAQPKGVVLVDTPCSAGETRALRPFLALPWLRHPRTMLHLCLSLQHGLAGHEATLRFGADHAADCVAVCHVDLAAAAGAVLPLLLAAPQRLSVASASPDPAAPPLPLGAAPFLEALRRGD